jgi:hypothetical protein
VLEEVRGEYRVDSSVVDHGHLTCAGRQDLDAAAGELHRVRVQVDGDSASRCDAVHELAVAGAEVHDRAGLRHQLLEHLVAEHPPQRLLARQFALAEAIAVQLLELTLRFVRRLTCQRLSHKGLSRCVTSTSGHRP